MSQPTGHDDEPAPTPSDALAPATQATYCHALTLLNDSRVPYLIGGAYAFERYTGIARRTKDLDVFVRGADLEPTLAALKHADFWTEIPFPHWLAKAHCGDAVVDIIYCSGNGLAPVDEDWFAHATADTVLGIPVKTIPAEEMIWQKAMVMERERFDGADVAHLLRARGSRLDWHRLFERFDGYWHILLSHLVLFGFIYPDEPTPVPLDILTTLLRRCEAEARQRQPAAGSTPGTPPGVCRGTILSRSQYVVDVERWGYRDGRVAPYGRMTTEEADAWTEAGKQPA
ncbi:MAG: nucleotidyltransferase [Chloroflexi bacterium]|nr:nucleotidyltransferase [Chloroflexota bacterium]